MVYEQQNAGQNPGAWVKRYLTTDYQGSVRMAHDAIGDEEQHYDLFGAEDGQPTRRTGWLDREIDWETSPIDITFRTVDLVHRKYDPQRAVFLTSDPLWMMSADASSYHYGYHDPMNMVDPWGLDGITTWCEDEPVVVIPIATSSNNPEAENESSWHNFMTFYTRLLDALDERGRRIVLGLVSSLIQPGSIRDDTPPEKLTPMQSASMMRGNQEARQRIVADQQLSDDNESDINHESGGYLFGGLPTSFTTVKGNFEPISTVNGKWSGDFLFGLTAIWHTHSLTGGEPPSIPDLYWITSAAYHKGKDALGIAVITHTPSAIYAVKISDLARAQLFGEMMEHLDSYTFYNAAISRSERVTLAQRFSQFIRRYGGVSEWTTSPYHTTAWGTR
ncbi:MAG: hypothetical protein EHM43_09510 [Ignavibacteriae bacterium]|nr:MAG: hypothetical protein EHM43_09510 [Ignavibacteriota bacterium]